MTKEQFYDIYSLYKRSKLSVSVVSELFTNYINEVGTEQHKKHLGTLITVVYSPAITLITPWINYVMNYYKKKFNVAELYDKKGNFVTTIN